MALQGNEVLFVNGVQSNGQLGATLEQTTTGAIAALASSEGAPFIVTPITTVGNGTLTAASLVGGEVLRSGPVADFSDATDTAVAIIAALPGAVVGSSFSILIKNSTQYTQTITAGVGVTLPTTVITPAFSVNNYIATLSTAATLTFVHIDTTAISVGTNTTAPRITAVSTVGAGTLLASAFVGGLISRSGSQSGTPFTDTTDTAAAIISACANLVNKIGTSMLVEYANNTNAVATVTGGSGVTVSGTSSIPANTVAQFLVTYTAAATITMVGVGVTQTISSQVTLSGATSGQTIIKSTDIAGSGTLTLPTVTGTLLASATGSTGTFTATGVTPVTVSNTNVTANSQVLVTLKTVGGTVGTSAPNVRTITVGTGFTIAGIALDTSVYNYSIVG